MSKVKYLTDFEVKVAVRKILEVSYSGENGVALNTALEKGPVTIEVDQNGDVKSTVKFNNLNFSGDSTLKALGAQFKFIDMKIELDESNNIKYTAGIQHGFGHFSVIGKFDLEVLIDNSGLTGGAYRVLKGRKSQLDKLEKQSKSM